MTREITILAGTSIDRAATLLVAAARESDAGAACDFNGIWLLAGPATTTRDILAAFDEAMAKRPTPRPSLDGYTDAEIATEYNRRALAKLGDQRIGVFSPLPAADDRRSA